MTLSVAVSAIVIIVVLVIVALIVARRRARSEATPAVDENDCAEWGDDDSVAELVNRDPDVRWPTMLAQSSSTFDEGTRLRLIRDLALVRGPWCVAILKQAYEEEREPTLRLAAGEALDAFSAVIEVQPSTSEEL